MTEPLNPDIRPDIRPDLPADMVEQGARALADARVTRTADNATVGSYWDDPPVPPGMAATWRESYRAEVRVVLAAALTACTVREEEGLRLTWAPGDEHAGKYDEHWDRQRDWARGAVDYHHRMAEEEPRWRVRATLRRRLVITTTGEEAAGAITTPTGDQT